GTLDLSPDLVNNGLNFGEKPFVVSGVGVGGNGAIINNGTNQQNAFQNITLTGNTTFGGDARFDIRGGTPTLSTGGQPFNLTKKGAGQFTMVGVSVDTNLANIDVQGGSFGLQDSTTLGNPTNTLTVESGALLHFNAPTAVPNKVFVLQDSATVDCTGGSTNNI